MLPFPMVYTEGINPLFWCPVTGIGSFDLPSYEIEVTSFLGKFFDGKEHTFGIGMTNALDVSLVDAKFYLFIEDKSSSAINSFQTLTAHTINSFQTP